MDTLSSADTRISFHPMPIYFSLHRLMKERGITGYALAQQTGLSPSAIYKLRKQRRWLGVKPKTLNALCVALNVQPGDLLEHRPR